MSTLWECGPMQAVGSTADACTHATTRAGVSHLEMGLNVISVFCIFVESARACVRARA